MLYNYINKGDKKMSKKYEMSIGTSLPKPFMEMIDEILEKNPDFKNRTAVIRYAVRKYYEFLKGLKKV